ncbi:MAG: FAD-binding oxidoreductase [Candidatus Saccharimonadales bacterium]
MSSSNLADHLRKHLRGEVVASDRVLSHFSTDASLFSVRPKAAIYPRDVNDVRKVARFSWQLSERGKKLSITPRGKGTNQNGGAIGNGLIVALARHMNKLIDMDANSVTLQPGMGYVELQKTLLSHGKHLPIYPETSGQATIGGILADNSYSRKAIKYGLIADHVQELEVVLANGQVIRTKPLSKRELNKKKGQTDLEGEIYRAVDSLLLDNEAMIEQLQESSGIDMAGYNLWDVRGPKGEFDLSKLIIGSQGSLGIITEAVLTTTTLNPDVHLVLLGFDDVTKAVDVLQANPKLKPSSVEMVDSSLIEQIQKHHPDELKGVIEDNVPAVTLLVEFDDEKTGTRKHKVKKLKKAVKEITEEVRVSTDPDEQDDIRKAIHSFTSLTWVDQGKKKFLPITDGLSVPVDRIAEFIPKAYEICSSRHLDSPAIWGSIGDGHFQLYSWLDLDNAGDRQTVFKVMDELSAYVASIGGSVVAGGDSGRYKGAYLRNQYGEVGYGLFTQVKQVFDPQGILNPEVKLGSDKDSLRKIMRSNYEGWHLYETSL